MLSRIYAPAAEDGIYELLSGKASSEVVTRVNGTNLTFVPASKGVPNRNASEDEKLAKLLGRLRDVYDLVVIDAPPLLPVADARSLIPLVDGVILVVQWGKTTIDALIASTTQSPGLSEKLTGAVLAQVDPRKARSYDPYGSGYDQRTYQLGSRWARRPTR